MDNGRILEETQRIAVNRLVTSLLACRVAGLTLDEALFRALDITKQDGYLSVEHLVEVATVECRLESWGAEDALAKKAAI